jgi:hypothetical protein
MNDQEITAANERELAGLQVFNRALDVALPGARRELQVLPVSCRFYGMNGMFGHLVPSLGNQCGLIVDRHAPCQMEMAHQKPDEKTCPLVRRIFGDGSKIFGDGSKIIEGGS